MTGTVEMTLQELLDALGEGEDRSLLEQLLDEGLIAPPLERRYTAQEFEDVRVARVLLRELEVNTAGVEVILHMRQQIFALQRQFIEVLELLRASRKS